VLGVPCITLRSNTERPITCDEGTNQLVGNDKGRILEAARGVLDGFPSTGRVPEKWDGKAAERIVQVLQRSFRTPRVLSA
jgi:UDP-N-acetylglucosamine 2-epimerase (non-hydrolysing)